LEEVKKGGMKNTKERGLRMKTMHALIERDINYDKKKKEKTARVTRTA